MKRNYRIHTFKRCCRTCKHVHSGHMAYYCIHGCSSAPEAAAIDEGISAYRAVNFHTGDCDDYERTEGE